MKYLDASIVAEAMAGNTELAENCKEIIQALETGRERVITSPFTVMEIYFILHRDSITEDIIAEKINSFLNLSGLNMVEYNSFRLKDVLSLSAKYRIDLIDATNIQLMHQFKVREIYSLDRHYDRFKDISRLTQLKS